MFVEVTLCPGVTKCVCCAAGETLLSPLVMCGPHGLKFLKPVELRLPHCASMTPDGWSFALKSSDSSSGTLSSLSPFALLGSYRFVFNLNAMLSNASMRVRRSVSCLSVSVCACLSFCLKLEPPPNHGMRLKVERFGVRSRALF